MKLILYWFPVKKSKKIEIEIDKEKEKETETDKNKNKDKDKDKDKDRNKNRNRDRDRDRSRNKGKDNDNDKNKDKERGKEKDRNKSKSVCKKKSKVPNPIEDNNQIQITTQGDNSPKIQEHNSEQIDMKNNKQQILNLITIKKDQIKSVNRFNNKILQKYNVFSHKCKIFHYV